MATTLPNMSLRQWNLASDPFSRAELADNFQKLDDHDHTTGKGVQVPSGGIANGAVTNAKLATSAVDGTKVLNGSLTDVELASPGNGVWRTFYDVGATVVDQTGTSGAPYGVIQTSSVVPTNTDSSTAPLLSRIVPSDYAVSGLITRWRLVAVVIGGQTAPGVNLSFALNSVTSGTASANNTIRLVHGTAVAGSTVTINTPSANSLNYQASSEFQVTSADYYTLTFTPSGTTAANARFGFRLLLQMRHTP